MLSDIPPRDAPLPDVIKFRNGWIQSLVMTGIGVIFVVISIVSIFMNGGMLPFIAIFAFIPVIWLGVEHIRTGGSYVLLEPQRFTRGVYGAIHTWQWNEVSTFRVDTLKGQTGVWCRQDGGAIGDDIFIETGSRDPEKLADILNRFRQRAIGERFKV